MEPKTDFEVFVNFQEKYPFSVNQEGVSFEVVVSEEFISDAEAVLRIDDDALSFLKDKYHGIDQIQYLLGKSVLVEVSFQSLRRRGINVYEDWSKFLANVRNKVDAPDCFIIINDGTIYPSKEESAKVRHYFDIVNFVKILRDNSDHTVGPDKLVFLHKTNIQFNIVYGEKDIEAGLDGISIVLEMFSGDEHSGQKKSLLKENLHKMLSDVKQKDRFEYLLSHFGEFSTQLTQSYQLFVSEFSFDDIRREYEEKARDYVAQINDVFSDVQTRMLGVPAILALAAFRFSTIAKPDQFWPNAIILVAVFIYVYMMFFLVKSQKDTLGAIKREIRSQMKRFRKGHKKEARRLKIFEYDLEKRCEKQQKLLTGFYWIIGGLFIVTLIIFSLSFHSTFIASSESGTQQKTETIDRADEVKGAVVNTDGGVGKASEQELNLRYLFGSERSQLD